jgi:hypothetical protein
MADELRPTRNLADWAAVLVALMLPTAITWVYFFGADEAATSTQLTVFNVVKVLQFALPIVWVVAVQKGRATLRPRSGRGVGLGLAFGAVVAAAMFGLYYGLLRDSSLIAGALPVIRDRSPILASIAPGNMLLWACFTAFAIRCSRSTTGVGSYSANSAG